MSTLVRLTLAVVIAATLTGCRCIANARSNGCLLCQPNAQCIKEQIRAPADWCWGNCQVDNAKQELPAYMYPDEPVR